MAEYEDHKVWTRQARKAAKNSGIGVRRDGDELVYYVQGRPDLGEHRRPAPEVQ